MTFALIVYPKAQPFAQSAVGVNHIHNCSALNMVAKSRLRRHMAMRYALLNPILEELDREGRIKRAIGKHGELISLKD